MVETPIQMRDVLRHQQNACMITEASKSDFIIAKSSIEKGKIEQRVLENYLAKSRGDGSKENVFNLLQLEASLEKNNMDSIIPYLTKEIIPHVKDMNDLIVKVDNINISDNKKEEIKKSIKEAKVINRIIKNHNVISKNMNYESELNYYELSKNSDRFIRQVCETVNSLNAPQYAKLNIALEEVLYDDYVYGLAIPKKYCVEAVTDYFLFSPFDQFTLNEYARLLQENMCISYSDCEGIKYLFESETFADADDVKDLIKRYKKDDNKNASKLEKLVKKVYALPPEAVINETPTLFGVIRGSLLLATFSVAPILAIITFMVDRFIQFSVRRNQADKMKNYFKAEMDRVDDLIDETSDDKKREKLESYKKCLDKCTDKIVEHRNKMYTDKELDAEWNFDESAVNIQPMRLNEFKLYKFNNLMDVAKYANKYIETVYKRAKDAVKNKLDNSIFRPIGEKDYVNESNLIAHIDRSDDRICICIETFEFSDVDYAHNEMTRLCEALNSATNNPRYLFFYEYTADDKMELYLKEATPITLTNKESEEQASMFAGMDFNKICDIEMINELVNNENLLESVMNILNEGKSKDRITFSSSFKDVRYVLRSLSKQELIDLGVEDGNPESYRNSSSTFYRKILLVNGNPAAFIEVDKYPEYKGAGFIGVATNPNYRHKGYADTLIKKFIVEKPKSITFLNYSYKDGNVASKALGEKNGFSGMKKGNDGFNTIYLNTDKMPSNISEATYEIMSNDTLLGILLSEDVNIKDKVTNKATAIKNNVANTTDKVKDKVHTKTQTVKDNVNNKVDKVKDNLSRKREIGEDDSKEKGFKGINLNSIKLALAGTKKKAKDLSAKEQEMSRQLDYTANNLVKSVQNALTNDRREGLIKGSVIPSFSKCIKICIALAGTGYFAGPGVAMITAIIGLANSKRLNFKERALLLDEIEIELKIVEKEINLAESDNDVKKLRTLMQYQKTLQREYQRLKYNLKVKSRTTTITGNANTNVTHTLNGRNYGIKGGGDD